MAVMSDAECIQKLECMRWQMYWDSVRQLESISWEWDGHSEEPRKVVISSHMENISQCKRKRVGHSKKTSDNPERDGLSLAGREENALKVIQAKGAGFDFQDLVVDQFEAPELESKALPDNEEQEIHVPFGEDVAKFLGGVHKRAETWIKAMRKLGLFDLDVAAHASGRGEDSQWEEFLEKVDKKWDLPEVKEVCARRTQTVFIDRIGQLISKMPSRADGDHAKWMKDEATAQRSGSLSSPLDACLRKHHGEIRSCKVEYRVRWHLGAPWPRNCKWTTNSDGSMSYWMSAQTSFELADVFQYYPGNGSDLYRWYCSQEVVRPPKKKTQSMKAASVFDSMKQGKTYYRSWLTEMKVPGWRRPACKRRG